MKDKEDDLTCFMDVLKIEDHIYKCRCSNCKQSTDPWDNYCKHCGARAIGERRIS